METARRIEQKFRLVLLALMVLTTACSTLPITNEETKSFRPSQSIDIDGLTINYTYDRRQPEEFVVVLIHGFGVSLESWFDIHPLLTQSYPVLRVDLKGFGFSAKPKDEHYSPEDHARVLVRVLNGLGMCKVVLVGHSFGGAVALLTYFMLKDSHQRPEVAGLVLIDSAGYPQALPFFVATYRNRFTRFLAQALPPELRVKIVLEYVFKVKSQISSERIERHAFFLRLPGSNWSLAQTANQMVPRDLNETIKRFSEIDVRTLILWGGEDPVISIEQGRRFHANIPGSQLAICRIPDTCHMRKDLMRHLSLWTSFFKR